MILRILTFTCAAFVAISSAQKLERGLTPLEFNQKFEDLCFQKDTNDPYKINGQENPLANTLENFIAFAERFELENRMLTLREEIYYFIRNYMFENIKLTTDGAEVAKPSSAEFSDIDKLFEPDVSFRERFPQVNEPFSDDERCSLYYMISHSILDKPLDMSMRSYTNESNNGRNLRPNINMDDYFPQEIGVVAIPGSDVPVSLSRVLMGLYVGINPIQNRRKDIGSFDRITGNNVGEDKFPQERMVDPLYVLTLAEVLMMGAWTPSETTDKRGFQENGNWAATPLGPNEQIQGFCPMVYKHEKRQASYSYSSIRGAADGLILGMVISSIHNSKPNTKLSQILRMYYSQSGVPVDQGTEDVYVPRVSFCNREDTLNRVSKSLESQMELYGLLVSKTFSAGNFFNLAKDLYFQSRPKAFMTSEKETRYCRPISLDKLEELPKETFLDVYVLMDSSVSEGAFQTQQRITGYLASYMDLRYTGSRMTILMDQKINTASSTAKIELKPIVEDSYSSSCVACTVGQIAYEHSSIERDQVIAAIDQLLEERKTNESKFNGANGKVVIYYNFETGDGQRRDNNKIQGRLDKALQDFFTRQLDTTVYAVGLETEVLKKYARNDPSLVFLSADGNEEEVAQKLTEHLSGAPSLLQYPDCVEGRAENSAIYENFVSPLSLQHWQMPAKYFYKSINLKVMFESQNGPITVCHSRATVKPENEIRNCMNTSATSNRIEFKMTNPCKSFTKETCSPFYFSVMGMPSNGDGRPRDFCTDMNDHWCSTLNDIKFKVSHQGIRCSGCLGLVTPPIMVLLTALLSYILNKTF